MFLRKKLSKVLFFFMVISASALVLCLDKSMGADDMVVAVDKSTLLKGIGLTILGILGEIWRGQRSLYKITTNQGNEIKKLQGFCAGKNAQCGESDEP